MTQAEEIRKLRAEVTRQANILLGGSSGSNTATTEDIREMYPGMPTQVARPIVHPYGFVSRSAPGTPQTTGRVGEHPAARIVLGHRDPSRPTTIQPGEAVVYSLGKYQVRVLNDKLQLGKDGDWEVIPVGETLRDFLIALVELYAAHKHIGNLGFYTTVPDNAAQATQLKTNNLDNDKILARDGGRY